MNINLFDEPHLTVYEAVELLREQAENAMPGLADLLEHLADEMSDEHAREVEHPDHRESHRWLVTEDLGRGNDYDRWTCALAISRRLLGQPDPNAAPAIEALPVAP